MRIIKSIKTLPFLLCLYLPVMAFLLFPAQAKATETEDTFPRIYDDAGLLSTSELAELEELCITNGEDAQIGIFILTHNDAAAVDGEVYIEDFYDSFLYDQFPDSAILLVDMANREVVFEGYGSAETYLHSKRGDVIIEKIKPYLSDGDYVSAFKVYIEKANAYMKDTSAPNYSRDYTPAPENGSEASSEQSSAASVLTNIWFQLVAAIVIGAVTVIIMAYNSGGKMTTGGNTYLDQSRSGLIGRRDDYIRTTVTRVRKPQNNNNSGGGFHGGVSAGGHSHSTSRGSF